MIKPRRHLFRTSTTLLIAAGMLILSSGGMLLSQSSQPTAAVLAYATSLNSNGLLTTTNQQRLTNRLNRLYINPQLTQAAQAKAQDMVAHNYWAHSAPSGKTPWDFIRTAGYSFSYAGENLAYGYPSSAEVVKGWMNSPGHRANILNSNYQEVGFGYANSPNYQGSGPQTVIVAIYARPSQPFTPPKSQPSVAKNIHNTIKRKVTTRRPVKAKPTSATPKPTPAQPQPKPVPQTPTATPAQPANQPVDQSTNQPNTDQTWYYYYLLWLLQWWNFSH